MKNGIAGSVNTASPRTRMTARASTLLRPSALMVKPISGASSPATTAIGTLIAST
jgi:hypothetical protein